MLPPASTNMLSTKDPRLNNLVCKKIKVDIVITIIIIIPRLQSIKKQS